MPMIRESTVDPIYTVAQFLSFLQIEGYLEGIQVPSWATGGTSVEELMLALKEVGDGKWLQEVYESHGRAEAADKWIGSYLSGEEVAASADVTGAAETPTRGFSLAALKKVWFSK